MSTCTHVPRPVATGSRRRRLVLRLSQKDALQALFQQNPYPGIATRERLARELGIAKSRVQGEGGTGKAKPGKRCSENEAGLSKADTDTQAQEQERAPIKAKINRVCVNPTHASNEYINDLYLDP
ncbi:hypothetical protein MG293_020883 [Ovis ammon polii]|uniref:Homeobox domain-containing protein n=1 Tax=Ovis ammon polii TaxID=230172 RepID=A0AAD4XWY4_OVIAM|nr:hypothetical protein MG293_020883 [Ovis ammon polii]